MHGGSVRGAPRPVETSLVVRAGATWYLTPADGVDPIAVPLADVLALLATHAPEPLAPVPRSRLPATPDGDDPWYQPIGGLVGRIVAGHLLVEATDGTPALLDATDLRLLDGFSSDGPMPTSALVELARRATHATADPAGPEPSPDDLAGRLRRMLTLGRLRPWEKPTEPTAEPTPPAQPTEPAPEPDRTDPPTAAYRPGMIGDPRVGDPVDGRIPVYAPFGLAEGPTLSLGMLTAAARCHDGGRLGEHYEIRRAETYESFLDDLATRTGPAIVLCSNYLWTRSANLAAVAQALAINPAVLAIHGGPHTPKYDDDCAAFFHEHGEHVAVAARGEGERTLPAILDALLPGLPDLSVDLLADVPGLTIRTSSGDLVRTADAARIDDLDSIPSPYLTGEFDHLDPALFRDFIPFETNRGCPYGCSFCDWGSLTLSRIRKFSLDRVLAEMAWAADRQLRGWYIADANLGIMARDVELVRGIVELHRQSGYPWGVGFSLAKNTTKHLVRIVDLLVKEGIAPHTTLALQSRDDDTLEAIQRTNISTDHYVAMAAEFRRSGLPLQADILMGLPGQTVASFAGDLAFLAMQDVNARIWVTQLLPNAPMNAPAYRAEHGVVADERGVVTSTNTFTPEDRATMKRVRHAYTVFERNGILRHVLHHLAWDWDVPIADALLRIEEVTRRHPEHYPLLNWTMRYFDVFAVPPLGWRAFYDEVRRFVTVELGVPATSSIETVLRVQRFLMPNWGRQFPESIALEHDYLAYHRDATGSLWVDGAMPRPAAPLASYGPAVFTVVGDPTGRCAGGMQQWHNSRVEEATSGFWLASHLELDSPLMHNYTELVGFTGFTSLPGIAAAHAHLTPTPSGNDASDGDDGDDGDDAEASALVTIGRRATPAQQA